MLKFPKGIATAALFATSALVSTQALAADKMGLGRAALPEEISAWDLDVSPNGAGLPVGSGSVEDGEMIFSDNCASCHGEFAEGVDNWPKLAGGEDTLADKDPVKTVGSYWPHLSTAWDYINRSMPYGSAQTLSDDDVYAIVAYILFSNFLVEDDFVLSNENFLEVDMPNADGFIIDDRAETEYPQWSGEPCMENCKESVEITMRALVLDVTPDEGFMWEEPTCPLSQAYIDDMAAIGTVITHAPSIQVPWLLVHGTADDVIPLQDSLDILERANEPKQLVRIDGADHVFSEHTQDMVKVVHKWVRGQVGRT